MKTILKKEGPLVYKEKGSKFISFAFNVKNGEEVENRISEIKREFHDATHICYAYRIIEDGKEYYRYNDDGEVSGTAGLPIFNEIKAGDLYNILVIVIRYYGGVKLGKGGLVRAYGGAAKKVLNIAKKTDFFITKELIVKIPFEIIGKILNIINSRNYHISENIPLKSGVKIKLSIPEDETDDFIRILKDISLGKAELLL